MGTGAGRRGEGPGVCPTGRFCGGFTLVEALLTVAILALAVSLALPRIRAGYAQDIAAFGAASKLAADLRRARLVAIHDCYRDPNNVNRLGISVRFQPPDAERFTGYEMVRLHTMKRLEAPHQFDPTGQNRLECWGLGGCAEVRFNPLGVAQGMTASGAAVVGDARIVVRGRRDIFVVSCHQASGSVEVEKVSEVPTS
jgi:hypothetical protein